MIFSTRFYRTTAICSFISAGTTLLLIFLPKFYGPADSIDARVALIHHPLWQLRAWSYLLHPFFTLTAALGVAVALRHSTPGRIVAGFLGFLLWAFTEAAQQTLTLVVYRRWAAAYPQADAAGREVLQLQIASYDNLWDAMFLLLLLGFFAGNMLYGGATIRGHGLTRLIGIFYFGAAFLTLLIISRELNGPTLPPIVETWLYPLLQPAARFTIGIWLWRARDNIPAS
jgi:hypothetical protein